MKRPLIAKKDTRTYLPEAFMAKLKPAGIAFVGTGFVFDIYLHTRHLHPWLQIRGFWDRNPERREQVQTHFGLTAYASFEALLEDPAVDIVVNLTNPSEHFAVNKAIIEAGKHAYSEKPFATRMELARELTELAERRGVQVGSAPSTLFGETAQTLWHALRQGMIGEPRLVMVNLDEGVSHAQRLWEKTNESGATWPAWDEYRVGCTVEHAGYALSWLVAFFGPVRRVLSSSHLIFKDKGIPIPVEELAPDFSTAMLEFDRGVVAQFTSSIVGPPNHGIIIVGETGTLRSDHVWPCASPVKFISHARSWEQRQVPFVTPPVWDPKALTKPWYYRNYYTRDFFVDPADRNRGVGDDKLRGVAEFALALAEGRPFALGGAFSTHITEVTYAIQDVDRGGRWQTMQTSAPAIEPRRLPEGL
jgi:predicted dehydrogenase